MKKYRVGIIGLGFGVRVHVPAFRRLKNVEVSALCATDLEKARREATHLKIEKYYDHWVQMIETEKLDLISVALPPKEQEAVLKMALEARLPVFAEKPVTLSFACAEAVAKGFKAKNLPAIVDFEFCKLKTFEHMKILLDTSIVDLKEIDVQWHVNSYYNKEHLVSWKTHPLEGGVLGLFGSHCLFNLEWFGGPIDSISATLSKNESDPRETETVLCFSGRFRTGVKFRGEIDTNAGSRLEHSLTFLSSDSTYQLRNLSLDFVSGFDLLKNEALYLSEKRNSFDGRILPVSKLAQELVNWCKTGNSARPDLTDGLRVQLLSKVIRASASNGGTTLTVPPLPDLFKNPETSFQRRTHIQP